MYEPVFSSFLLLLFLWNLRFPKNVRVTEHINYRFFPSVDFWAALALLIAADQSSFYLMVRRRKYLKVRIIFPRPGFED